MARGKHGNHARGSRHHRWNAGRITNRDGYVKVRVGVDHPLADPNGYAYEHLVVWAAAGRPLPAPSEILHHHNEDRADNRVENLHMMTRSDHNRLHNEARRRDDKGRFLVADRAGRLLDGVEHNGMPR